MNHFIRQDLIPLRPYETHIAEGNVRLDANENPFPWPEGMREELFMNQTAFNRYPDGGAMLLRESISAYNGVKAEEILVGNGSDELIQLILNTFGGKGRAVVTHPPTFSMYAVAAAITGTALTEVPLLKGTKLDSQGILTNCADDARQKVIIICNPNNPTGTLFPREEILSIIRNTNSLVVVDEAYFEFSGETLIDEINEYPNLLIMRTFSKAFGMAGLRLGYVAGNRELIACLNKVRQPFNVNTFSQQAAVVALKYVSAYQDQIKMMKSEIQILYHELGKIPGVTVLPTRANFLLFQSPDSERWAEELFLRGFTVRYLGSLPGLGKSLRMSSGTPEENRAFLQALCEIAQK